MTKPNGEPWLLRSSAQKVADAEGGTVHRSGDGWGVRRNVDQSESRRDQTETPEFKRWFGNSKVVDADGQPLRVYHGTDQSFDAFDVEAWFTPSARDASTYSNTQQIGRASCRERGCQYV